MTTQEFTVRAVSSPLTTLLLTCTVGLVHVYAAPIITFEPAAYTGSSAGTSIAGQNGWTTPTGSASVYTYAGNSLGLSANSTGGLQFAGMSAANPSPGAGSTPAVDRMRQPLSLSSSSTWEFSYDVAALSNGPTDDTGIFNFASVPILDGSGNIVLAQLAIWDTSNAGSTWSIEYEGSDSSGVNTFFSTPGAAWQGLAQNQWYHLDILFNFTQNRITQESITNLSSHSTSTVAANPALFLGGGSSNPLAPAMFGATLISDVNNGSTTSVGWDNIAFTSQSAVPEPSTLIMAAGALAALVLARRGRRLRS